jgi:hypothetical protein
MAKYPSIPDPIATPESLRQSVTQLKEAVEILTRQRKPITAGAVTWQDLLDLELITLEQVPRR